MNSLRLYYTPHYATVYCWKVIVISSLRARYQASSALQMTSAHFWGVTQLSLIVTDVSGQLIGSILKGKLSCPETRVRNYRSAQRDIPEERISLRFMCPWLQYIPLSLTKRNIFPTLYLYFHMAVR